MKIQFDDFDVDIKVHYKWEERANKEAFIDLLNRISILYREAGQYNLEHYGTDLGYTKPSKEIYDFLDKMGVYDEFK